MTVSVPVTVTLTDSDTGNRSADSKLGYKLKFEKIESRVRVQSYKPTMARLILQETREAFRMQMMVMFKITGLLSLRA